MYVILSNIINHLSRFFAGDVYLDNNNNVLDDELIPQYILTITVHDGRETSIVDLTVNVLNVDVNTAPYYINLPESVSVNEDVTVAADIFDVDASDDDGDTLTYSLSDVSPTTSVFAIDSGSKYYTDIQTDISLKRLNQAKIIKKSVFLFWLLNMTI